MAEEASLPTATARGMRCNTCCACMCWIGALILVVIGTGVMSQWTAWARYKKHSADENSITITTESGKTVNVSAGHYIKEFRTVQRVDVVANDKATRTIYYRPRNVTVKKK